MVRRPRRNRKSHPIRQLVQETRLLPTDFVQPYFVLAGDNQRSQIVSMPGVERLSIDYLLTDVELVYRLGIPAILLFPVVPEAQKHVTGREALNPLGTLPQAAMALKREFPELCVMADIALDPYTTHGHDGLVDAEGHVLNDETVEVLGQAAVMLAECGVDVVAPSDMMDGRVAYIRGQLDRAGFQQVSIMAYSAKYASAFYGPFRDALNSAPRFGDKRTYQMDPANAREAALEALLDEQEGADMIMVKPALPYLDVVRLIREQTHLPVAAYQVSGEYAMVKAAAMQGWIDGERVMLESLIGIKRAGADIIISYAAKEVVSLIRQQSGATPL